MRTVVAATPPPIPGPPSAACPGGSRLGGNIRLQHAHGGSLCSQCFTPLFKGALLSNGEWLCVACAGETFEDAQQYESDPPPPPRVALCATLGAAGVRRADLGDLHDRHALQLLSAMRSGEQLRARVLVALPCLPSLYLCTSRQRRCLCRGRSRPPTRRSTDTCPLMVPTVPTPRVAGCCGCIPSPSVRGQTGAFMGYCVRRRVVILRGQWLVTSCQPAEDAGVAGARVGSADVESEGGTHRHGLSGGGSAMGAAHASADSTLICVPPGLLRRPDDPEIAQHTELLNGLVAAMSDATMQHADSDSFDLLAMRSLQRGLATVRDAHTLCGSATLANAEAALERMVTAQMMHVGGEPLRPPGMPTEQEPWVAARSDAEPTVCRQS